MKTVFYNAKIVTPEIIKDGGVEVDNGKIARVFRGDDYDKSANAIDCKGKYLTPGFVDTHLHEVKAGRLSAHSTEELEKACMFMAEHGTTAVLPSCGSAPWDQIQIEFETIKKGMNEDLRGAKVLGGHLEGVFMNKTFAGAQAPNGIHDPVKEEYMWLLNTGILKRVSASPEIPGALEMGRILSREGVCMSIAHSAANYDEVLAAMDNGYNHATHIYNALSYLNNCYYYPQIGACEAALLHDEITIEAICDGKHVPKPLLRLMHKIKGADHFQVITDACASGFAEGEYFDDGHAVVRDGVGVLADKDVFAGSATTGDVEVKVLMDAGIPFVDVIKMMTLTPAKTIHADSIGRIAEGYDADINIIDENYDVVYTMINGKEFKNIMK